jgi:hypothetical protein
MEIIRDVALVSLSEKSGVTALVAWFEKHRKMKVVKAFDVGDESKNFTSNDRPLIKNRGWSITVNLQPTHLVAAFVQHYPRRNSKPETFLVEAKPISAKTPAKKALKKGGRKRLTPSPRRPNPTQRGPGKRPIRRKGR